MPLLLAALVVLVAGAKVLVFRRPRVNDEVTVNEGTAKGGPL